MLLIVAGAGASYDSIPTRPPRKSPFEQHRPPLADELFEPRETFEEVQRRMPQVMQVAPALQPRKKGGSVEDVLESFVRQSGGYPQRLVQLAAVRFYIQSVIAGCEAGWYREKPVATNMMALVDQIEQVRGDRAYPLFVTFNYDRLIESALENRGQAFQSLDDYARADGIAVIKLHGSVNWARPVTPIILPGFSGNAWLAARQIADRISQLSSPGDIAQVGEAPTSRVKDCLAIPALAIPTKAKDSFECPPQHVAYLQAQLGKVRTVVTVGWRGGERHFLSMLKERAAKQLEVICVAGNERDAAETAKNLRPVLNGATCQPYPHGFTRFVQEQAIGRILNLTWDRD